MQSPYSIRYIYNNKLFLAINIDISNINTKKRTKNILSSKKNVLSLQCKKNSYI